MLPFQDIYNPQKGSGRKAGHVVLPPLQEQDRRSAPSGGDGKVGIPYLSQGAQLSSAREERLQQLEQRVMLSERLSTKVGHQVMT
jgi:hypothetical protein